MRRESNAREEGEETGGRRVKATDCSIVSMLVDILSYPSAVVGLVVVVHALLLLLHRVVVVSVQLSSAGLAKVFDLYFRLDLRQLWDCCCGRLHLDGHPSLGRYRESGSCH